MGKKKKKTPGPAPSKGKDPMRSFRVPDTEWEAWKNKAESSGMSLAGWIRKLANAALK
jgi:hypothetical protein